jgi:hypothetical protein
LRPLRAQIKWAAPSRAERFEPYLGRGASAPSRLKNKQVAMEAGSELNFAIDYEME